MATLEELDATLRVASGLLDTAAAQLRDLALPSTADHMRSLAEAIASIFDVQNAIYRLRPDLRPAFLSQQVPIELSEANRRLTRALAEAYRLSDENNLTQAIRLLETFIGAEASQYHKDIASGEVERLRDANATPNSAVERTVGSHALATAAHREGWAGQQQEAEHADGRPQNVEIP